MNKSLLCCLLLLLPALAIPMCASNSGLMNLTITNSTPIMEFMTIDIVSTLPVDTKCYMRVYDDMIGIMSLNPVSDKSTDTANNGLETLIGSRNDLIISVAGTMHKDLWISPWTFVTGRPYTLYIECGDSCENATFYTDSIRAFAIERVADNSIMGFMDNPIYWIGLAVFMVLFVFIVERIAKWLLVSILIPLLPP